MKDRFKSILFTLIGLLVGVLFLYLLLRGKDLGEIWGHIKTANPVWLIIAILIIFGAYVVRSIRWYYILLPVKKTSFWNLLSATLVGFMAVAILPLRVGEIIRPYLLARRENISKSLTFATVIPLERIFDLAAILTFFASYLVFVPTPSNATPEQLEALTHLKNASIYLIAGISLAVVFFVLLNLKTEKFMSIFHKVFSKISDKFAEKLEKVLRHFIDGLTAIKSFKQFCLVYFWSMATWFVILLAFWSVIRAFGFNVPIYHMFVLIILTSTGAAIPVPAGVGSWHAFAYIGIHYFFGIPSANALAIVFVMHLVGFMVPVILGPLFAIGEMKEISEILAARKKKAAKENA